MEGEGKVRDKRLENGMGQSHAYHIFQRLVRCMGQGRVEEGFLTLGIVHGEWGVI